MNPNVMYFFRYRFMMDPQADASRFSLMFGDLQADDALKGVYLNGKLVRTTAVPANPEEKLTDSRLFASGGAQFKPGENEMIFAVLNIGDITKPPLYVDAHGHQPSMVALHLAAPIGGQCAPQPTISTPVIPAGVLTATTPMAYSGSLTNWGHSTVAQIRTLNTATNIIYGPFYAR
ncbi:hypothetical protein [Diaphorobacter aerolatus]|uniref:Uncharacterized protein n=1 Tax=Diaphorobacter aerolatus TaxID=1288495 RepID=A0A7H0GMR0_9BURK|nr:hypothetical protein [Diaphorobacter aerolatus]QNP49576.1 hypothetical protein H9K75_06270 [Diaphorobacter aerolatus]